MRGMYGRLGLAVAINTGVMFLLTYALIATPAHFHPNVNRAYMAVLMALPMVVVMLVVMGSMYRDRKVNAAIGLGAAVAFVAVFALMRTQTPVGDEQFLRSMIPHHSSAIVMCEQASISDGDVRRLCEQIVRAQKEEIAEMERLLRAGR